MRTLWTALALILMVGPPAVARAAGAREDTTEAKLIAEIHAMRAARQAACDRGDFPAFASYYDGRGLQVENTEHLWTIKELWDENCVRAHGGSHLRSHDMHARALGNTVVTTNLGDQLGLHDGKEALERKYRFLDTYVRRNGRLVQVASGEIALPVAPADLAAVHVDPKVLDDYVGAYQMGPGQALKVTREGERLFGQGSDDPAPTEFLAENEITFHFPGQAWHLIFVRDASGQVTHALFHQDGSELPLPRMR